MVSQDQLLERVAHEQSIFEIKVIAALGSTCPNLPGKLVINDSIGGAEAQN